jgi:hypothetical protein
MSLAPKSIRRRRLSLVRAMALIAIIAADLAALRPSFPLGREIGRPRDMGQFILFAGGLHLLIILTIAFLFGMIARSAWHRRESSSNGPERYASRSSAS